MSLNTYRVPVHYVFVVNYDIVASSEQDACDIADRDCGLVLGGDIHTSNPESVTDWEADCHPDSSIGCAKVVRHA
ncbi:hypothetical protein [Alteromonas macleodii]|uniref:Uncharacterized protein n=1 Tax=Alteromonas macleodii TaxID=28108 RepID=A0AB36FKS4_ALTMA|nr:hypothetical protein [Alteromonas macleodii]OES24501.1 hypothetical protein BFV95_4768 [Alteromonas macleodii]OES25558.1 hypothetical protein BFV94_4411 [Alteromonas macleodii]OES25859.1 hypothetical protein BFV93_4322 [Alteromonas macleodii]OES38619.1 hypothetical protein BFV96_4730 [Alteromonas macleodii]